MNSTVGGKRRSRFGKFRQVATKARELERRVKRSWRKTVVFTAESLQHIVFAPATPKVRFRRIAWAVLRVLQVCKVCQEAIGATLIDDAWYAFVENMNSTNDFLSTSEFSSSFVCYVNNRETKKLDKLSFDWKEFKAERRKETIPASVKQILKKLPGTRNNDELIEIVKAIKEISTDFCKYVLETQKMLAQAGYYDEYRPNRVLIRAGLPADCVYFVIRGTLIQKSDDPGSSFEIKAGRKFGEEDIIFGRRRKDTVITKTKVELFVVHKSDYQLIFNMASDANDISHLPAIRQQLLLLCWPQELLKSNPGTWTKLNYKFGTLLCNDSNETDYIYIIKSGECRVIKYLEPQRVDEKERMKKIREQERNDQMHSELRVMSFMVDKERHPSRYKQGVYTPPASQKSPRFPKLTTSRRAHSAPAVKSTHESPPDEDARPFTGIECIVDRLKDLREIKEEEEEPEEEDAFPEKPKKSVSFGNYIRTVANVQSAITEERESTRNIPHYVQLETLYPGQIFGLRSCLEPYERGPSASLISSGCEVIQINRSFFRLHCDATVFQNIRNKHKPYQSQEEIVDRLMANYEWRTYKQSVLKQVVTEVKGRTVKKRSLIGAAGSC